MSASCTRCFGSLPRGWPETRPCPRCQLVLGLSGNDEEDAPELVVTDAARGEADTLGPAPTALELDGLFPDLQVLELLGEGGMGAVYRARQTDLDRPVALKVLRPRIDPDGSLAERFLREARSLAKLSHPGIVTVFDFGRVGERLYLVMELVEGTNLRTLLRSGDLEPAETLALVSQMCAALQAAHEHGVVHRDIKPENVLVDRKGRVKIVDFGLAKVSTAADAPRLTLSGQAMGTPQYMAPEQMERPLEVDHRADLYSLGVVVYELLTGELPLGRFAPPSDQAGVDVRLDEVVDRALEKDPARRYQAAEEMGTRVDEIRTTPPLRSGTTPPPLPQHAPGERPSADRFDEDEIDAALRAAPPSAPRHDTRSGNRVGCVIAAILVALLLMPLGCFGLLATSRVAGPSGTGFQYESLPASPGPLERLDQNEIQRLIQGGTVPAPEGR